MCPDTSRGCMFEETCVCLHSPSWITKSLQVFGTLASFLSQLNVKECMIPVQGKRWRCRINLHSVKGCVSSSEKIRVSRLKALDCMDSEVTFERCKCICFFYVLETTQILCERSAIFQDGLRIFHLGFKQFLLGGCK